MAEQTSGTTATEETTNSQGQEQQESDFKPITIGSQKDLDALFQDRIARERKKFADYDDIKSKAAKLDQLEESQKTEAQKAADALAAAEKRAAELEVKATRAEVAAASGVPAELLSGSTREELEASAAALIAFRGEQRMVVAAEGKHPENLALNGDGIEAALRQKLGIR